MIRAERRRTGTFYTPAPLAREVVRRTLAPLTGGRGPLRICDPACGEGVFLAEAARRVPHARLFGVDVDRAALARARARLPAGTELRCADALAMDWNGLAFDAVVGNPPWMSFSGRHAQPPPPLLPSRPGWPSLHARFLELAVRIARGRVGLLLPAQVLDLDGYAAVRARVRGACRVDGVMDCGEGSFAGVTQPVCALFLVRAEDGEAGGGAPFLRVADPYAGWPRPPPDAFADIGVHTGNCARKLLRPGGVPIREGRDVLPFRVAAPRRTFHPATPRGDGEYFRAGPLARYRAVPILVRQTAGRPIAALHEEPTYFRNSVLACFGLPGWPHALTVAWLNSSAVADYHRARVRESRQRAFPQVKLRHLRDLPVPCDPPPRRLLALAAASACADARAELDAALRAWLSAAS